MYKYRADLCAKGVISQLGMVQYLFRFSDRPIFKSTCLTGTGGESIYGEKFEDEAFAVNHTKPFLLSMVYHFFYCSPQVNQC